MVKKACKLFWLVIIPSLNFDILFKATLHDSQVFCRFGVCKRLLCSCFLVTLWTDYSKHFLNNSQISRTLAVGSWTLVVHENGEIFKLFFLQELRLHTVSVVVRILRWIFSTGIGLNLHIMFNFLSPFYIPPMQSFSLSSFLLVNLLQISPLSLDVIWRVVYIVL